MAILRRFQQLARRVIAVPQQFLALAHRTLETGPATQPKPSTARMATSVAILLGTLLIVLYFAAYFWQANHVGTTRQATPSGDVKVTKITRLVHHRWQVTMYKPASVVESWLRRIQVELVDASDE